MRAVLLMLVVASFATIGTHGGDKETEKAFAQLQGTWIVEDAEKDGLPLDRVKEGTLLIKDQNFHIRTKSGFDLKGDLQINPSKKPKHIDLVHQDGMLRDKTWPGIYELNGDTLKLCYAEADKNKDRPSEFKTTQDSGLLLVVMKRKKD